MSRTLLTCSLYFAILGKVLGSAPQVAAEVEGSMNAVPESSIAILFGGLLWFLLLRRRA